MAGRTETVSHTLNDDVNVFWGPNGNGKTSMLRILHSALTNNVEELRTVSFVSARVEFYSENYNKAYVRTITKETVESSKPRIERVYDDELEDYVVIESTSSGGKRWSTTPKMKRGVNQFQHSWLPIGRVTNTNLARHPSRQVRRRAITQSDLDAIFAEGIDHRWRDWNFRSTRLISAARDAALTEVLEVALRGARRDASVEPLEPEQAYKVVNGFFGERNFKVNFKFRNLAEFQSQYEKEPVLRDIVQRLQKVELEIARIREPQKRLEELIKQLFSKGRTIAFDQEEGIVISINGNPIPIGYLSSGERQLMLILLECLRSETSTIMIDEPELSMHVDWQNRLIASMRRINPDPQLIMATHSPEIMAELDDRCVIEL